MKVFVLLFLIYWMGTLIHEQYQVIKWRKARKKRAAPLTRAGY